jgi:hypothetical protein
VSVLISISGVYGTGSVGSISVRTWSGSSLQATTYTPVDPSGTSGYTPETPGGAVIWIPTIVT